MTYDSARNRVVLFGGSAVADTWEYDGVDWVQRTTVSSPSARSGHAMTYDSARNRVVLFGGSDAADTWEYDGLDWVQRTPVISPSARSGHAMTYDSARNRVVLFGGGAVADTWEYDGVDWVQRTPATSPSARSDHAMVYDGARSRAVLAGGRVGSSIVETWEYDGTDWALRNPVISPPGYYGRTGHSLVYDSSRSRIVLFGGDLFYATFYGDTWEYDGASWFPQPAATTPFARSGHELAYDGARGRLVLVGGGTRLAIFTETWESDGASWHLRTLATNPSISSGHALAYDSVRGRIVLFGGGAGSGPVAETWDYDGVDWAQRVLTTSPPPTWFHEMAYDSARGRVVLFGGQGNGGGLLADTWEYDGVNWAQRMLAANPPARKHHALAYDSGRGRLVLFGGEGNGGGYLADTWEYDGVNWVERTPATSPSARFVHAMAYDSVRGVVVLFGGLGNGSGLADTWEYDGVNWAVRMPATSPEGRFGHAMAHDDARGLVVLFGGRGNGGRYHDFSDTWEYEASPTGRALSQVAAPQLGLTATFTLTHPVTAAGNPYAFLWCSPSFAGSVPVSVPGVTVHGVARVDLSRSVSAFSGLLDTSGSVSHSVAVPNHTAFIGYRWDLQSVDLDLPRSSLFFSDNELQLELSASYPTSGMVPITSGTFQMGSTQGRLDEQPVHAVTITRSLWMGKFEVSQAEYQAVMGSNPSWFQGSNRPVEQVSWYDAMAYCAALTLREASAGRLPSGYQYRLPTEAEWEYCCRAGSATEFNTGSSLSCQDANQNLCDGQTRDRGSYAANTWGLYDMHGNVSEWCLDSWDRSNNYPSGAVVDPYVTSGPRGLLRGGGWANPSSYCRSAARDWYSPSGTSWNLGFRVVLAPILVP